MKDVSKTPADKNTPPVRIGPAWGNREPSGEFVKPSAKPKYKIFNKVWGLISLICFILLIILSLLSIKNEF